MFSHFDGQYRSRPRVSLRGASKQASRTSFPTTDALLIFVFWVKEAKDTLLQRAHLEREQRENARRRTAAAVSVQSLYRGHRDREKQYGVFRAQFDNSTAGNDLQSLSRLLIIFYTERKDHSRL
ncbi:Ubiquitin-protein ligase E3C, partial [Geodia barretti]